MERDLEYWQLRLSQMRKYLKNPNCRNQFEIISNIQYCLRKIEQRYRLEVVLHIANEVMY